MRHQQQWKLIGLEVALRRVAARTTSHACKLPSAAHQEGLWRGTVAACNQEFAPTQFVHTFLDLVALMLNTLNLSVRIVRDKFAEIFHLVDSQHEQQFQHLLVRIFSKIHFLLGYVLSHQYSLSSNRSYQQR